MTLDCLVCGAQAVLTPSLIGGDDRWDCTACAAWGTVSENADGVATARVAAEMMRRLANVQTMDED